MCSSQLSCLSVFSFSCIFGLTPLFWTLPKMDGLGQKQHLWGLKREYKYSDKFKAAEGMAYLHHPAVRFLVSGLCRWSGAGGGAPAHRWSELCRNMLSSPRSQDFFHPHCTYETCEKGGGRILERFAEHRSKREAILKIHCLIHLRA